MNDLYLIGNGFDLAHGLKTSYNDFLLWYLKSSTSRICPNNHYEDDLLLVDRNTPYTLVNHDSVFNLLKECKELQINVQFKHDFFKKIVENCRDYRWIDIEQEYYFSLIGLYEELVGLHGNRVDGIKPKVIALNNCLNAIKKKLEEYLFSIQISEKQRNNIMEDILTEGTGPDCRYREAKLFLYFNYTSTLRLYDKISSEKNQVLHIHGKIEDVDNPIIFGYGDEMDAHYEKIELLNENEFLNNFKSFSYFKTSNYQDFIRFIDSNAFTVKILGHSCGLSDRILLNTVFEHKNCKSIKIFYFQKDQTENDYFVKTQEISRHFKASMKGEMRKKIVPFEKSIPLPQNPKEN